MSTIITIGRQSASGGSRIGRLLAESLGVPFYNKDVLREYAIENGLGKVMLEAFGEKHASSLLFSLSTGAYSFGYHDAQNTAISQKAYLTAFETIKEVARKGSCVIVGRCADYVLREHPDCLNLFVHAPLDVRAQTTAERYGWSVEKAREKVLELDRLRRNYYNYYTQKSWGEVGSYHLTVDSSALGVEGTAELLLELLRVRGALDGQGVSARNTRSR